jgi:hypothetical protein
MNKNISGSHWYSVLPLCFCLLSAQVNQAQDCKTQAANKPAAFVRAADAVTSPTGKMSPAEMAKMKPWLVKTESWIKNILTGFKGAKLLYYNIYFPDFTNDGTANPELYQSTGLKSFYTGKMMFFAYYCQDNNNKVYTEGESGSNVQIVLNNVFHQQLISEKSVHSINGKPIFRVIQKKRIDGRIDFYEIIGHDNANNQQYTASDYILIRNSDKPVFIPVTRKAYLELMLREIEADGINNTKEFTASYDRNIIQFEDEMKVYKATNKTYTAEREANRRKWFAEDQEKLKKLISKTAADVGPSKDVVTQYLKRPAEWLNRGFSNFYSGTFTAAGISEYLAKLDNPANTSETQYEIASINPAYFNNKLSDDVPQLIMLILQNAGYPHMLKVDALIKQPGALAPLQALLKPL